MSELAGQASARRAMQLESELAKAQEQLGATQQEVADVRQSMATIVAELRRERNQAREQLALVRSNLATTLDELAAERAARENDRAVAVAADQWLDAAENSGPMKRDERDAAGALRLALRARRLAQEHAEPEHDSGRAGG